MRGLMHNYPAYENKERLEDVDTFTSGQHYNNVRRYWYYKNQQNPSCVYNFKPSLNILIYDNKKKLRASIVM